MLNLGKSHGMIRVVNDQLGTEVKVVPITMEEYGKNKAGKP